MKAYKGFNKDMTCRDFQFEEGKTYEEERAELCHTGFHACEAPIDCFGYYAPGQSVYHEVELDATDERNSEDSKRVGKRIKIGAKLDIAGICKAQFEYVKSHCTNEYNAKPGKPATAGYRGAATAGESGAATAGYRGAATAGYRGAATAGYRGAATSRGSSAVGKNGIACARGNGVKVKGGMGAILIIAEEKENEYDIEHWKAFVIDGETYKPDTWYRLDGDEIVEVENAAE